MIHPPDQTGRLGERDKIVSGNELILLVANSRHRFVETDLALRQCDHRLQENIEPVLLDRGPHGREHLRIAGRAGSGFTRGGSKRLRRNRSWWGGGNCLLLGGSALLPVGGNCGCQAGGEVLLVTGDRNRKLLHQSAK